MKRLRYWLRAYAESGSTRKPDVTIYRGGKVYLKRWHLIPRNPIFNTYLHKFEQSDLDIAHHDHPWLFNISWLLGGAYREWVGKIKRFRKAGQWAFRWGRSPHRIELLTNIEDVPMPCYTLFITGPRVRQWGFLCPKMGWRPYDVVTERNAAGEVQARPGACE